MSVFLKVVGHSWITFGLGPVPSSYVSIAAHGEPLRPSVQTAYTCELSATAEM